MDADELDELMLQLRWLYRGGQVTQRQAAFLADVARSLDDLADGTPWVLQPTRSGFVVGGSVPTDGTCI